MVKYLLQVDPKRRPNCEALMRIPSFKKKQYKLFNTKASEEAINTISSSKANNLLKTITLPTDLS